MRNAIVLASAALFFVLSVMGLVYGDSGLTLLPGNSTGGSGTDPGLRVRFVNHSGAISARVGSKASLSGADFTGAVTVNTSAMTSILGQTANYYGVEGLATNNGTGLLGMSYGNGTGVYGFSTSYTGVLGESAGGGYGGRFTSGSGYGLYASSARVPGHAQFGNISGLKGSFSQGVQGVSSQQGGCVKVYGNYSTGSDTAGDGSYSKPFKTVQKCHDVIPVNVLCNYSVIYTSAGKTSPGQRLQFTNRALKDAGVYLSGPRKVYNSYTGTITSISNLWQNNAGYYSRFADGRKADRWTANALQYKYVYIKTGAAAGTRRPVIFNTATSCSIGTKWGGSAPAITAVPAVGDKYEVYTFDCSLDGTGQGSVWGMDISNVKGYNITDVEVKNFGAGGIMYENGATGVVRGVSLTGSSSYALRGLTSSRIDAYDVLATNASIQSNGKSILNIFNCYGTGAQAVSNGGSEIWGYSIDFSGTDAALADMGYMNVNRGKFNGSTNFDLKVTNNGVATCASQSYFYGASAYGIQTTAGGQFAVQGTSTVINKDGAGKYGCAADLHGTITGTANITYTMTNGATAEGTNVPTASSYGYID